MYPHFAFILVLFAFCLPSQALGAPADRARKALEIEDFAKSLAILDKAIERDSKDAEVLLLLGQTLSADWPGRDWEEALRCLRRARRYAPEPDSGDLLHDIEVHLDIVSLRVDEIHFGYAKDSGTEAAFRKYLRLWPDGVHRVEAEHRIQDSIADTALLSGTAHAYRVYLDSDDGREYYRRDEVENKLEAIAFDEAIESGKSSALKEYIKEFPHSQNIDEAQRIQSELHREEKRIQSELHWEEIGGTDGSTEDLERYAYMNPSTDYTLVAEEEIYQRMAPDGCSEEALVEYLAHTRGKYRRTSRELEKEAEARVLELYDLTRRDQIEQVLRKYPNFHSSASLKQLLTPFEYQQATAEDTIAAYERYLERYPLSENSKVARDRMEEIRQEETESMISGVLRSHRDQLEGCDVMRYDDPSTSFFRGKENIELYAVVRNRRTYDVNVTVHVYFYNGYWYDDTVLLCAGCQNSLLFTWQTSETKYSRESIHFTCD